MTSSKGGLRSYDQTSLIVAATASGILTLQVIFLVNAVYQLRRHRKATADEPAPPSWLSNNETPRGIVGIPLQMLLRLSYLVAISFAVCLTLATVIAAVLKTSSDLEDQEGVGPSWSEYDDGSRACVAMAKLVVGTYIVGKVFILLFFWFQQRLVRPTGPLSSMEKKALFAIACALPYAVIVMMWTTGTQYARDATCQLHMPGPVLITNVLAEVFIMVVLLMLFVCQYRDMVRSNQLVMQATPTSCQGIGRRASELLESVLRKHTIAFTCTIASSLCTVFMLVSNMSRESRLAKALPMVGALDVLIASIVMTWLLHKPRSNSVAPAPEAATQNASFGSGEQSSFPMSSQEHEHQLVDVPPQAEMPVAVELQPIPVDDVPLEAIFVQP